MPLPLVTASLSLGQVGGIAGDTHSLRGFQELAVRGQLHEEGGFFGVTTPASFETGKQGAYGVKRPVPRDGVRNLRYRRGELGAEFARLRAFPGHAYVSSTCDS